MKKLIYLVLFSLTIGFAKADLGAPTIQAICKVTLKSGSTVEGIITFGSGGYNYNYKPSGFCFVHDDGGKQLILYGFSFKKFMPENYASYRSGCSKLYYAKSVDEQVSPETKTELNEDDNILTRTTIDINKYNLCNQMVMYKKLPLSLYVGFRDTDVNDEVLIEISHVESVEILKEPGKKWLELIGNARKRLELEQSEEEWEDYMEPVWYHEIIEDKEMVMYLKQFFN